MFLARQSRKQERKQMLQNIRMNQLQHSKDEDEQDISNRQKDMPSAIVGNIPNVVHALDSIIK